MNERGRERNTFNTRPGVWYFFNRSETKRSKKGKNRENSKNLCRLLLPKRSAPFVFFGSPILIFTKLIL